MTISHASITDPNIHEPKGVNSAAINTAYVSDGAGSGSWSKIPTQGMAGVSGNGTTGQVFVVDGLGAHALRWPVSHGYVYFINTATPSVITYPSAYTKIAPTTIPEGNPREFTEATTARLTYTGIPARQAALEVIVSVAQSSGADRDVRLALYKNGIFLPSSEDIQTTVSGSKRQIKAMCNTPCATNDYFEAYVRNDGASGDVSVYSFRLSVRAFLS